MSGAVLTVGISGPDGSGKSTLAAGLADALRRRGRRARVVHLYGCVVCRRARSRPPRVSAPRASLGGVVTRLVAALHALVDALELWLRLRAARASLRRTGIEAMGPAVLVTDRSPLDALAKFDPPPLGRVAAAWLALARGFDRIVALDAPAVTLAARDGEHSVEEMLGWRERFAAWSARLPGVVVRPAAGPAETTLATVLDAVP